MTRRKLGCLILAFIVTLPVGLFISIFLNGYFARPGNAVDYSAEFIALVESHQPPGSNPADPNAFTLFQEIVAQNPDLLGGGQPPGFPAFELLYSPLPAERRAPDYEESVRRERQFFDTLQASPLREQLRAFARTPRAVPPSQPGLVFDWVLPHLGNCRRLARYNAARMAIAADTSDWPDFVDAFDSSMSLARFTTMHGVLIGGLTGNAISALASTSALRAMDAYDLDESTLRGLLAALDRHSFPPPSLGWKAERIGALSYVQATHSDDGRGGGMFILSEASQRFGINFAFPLPEGRATNFLGVIYPNKREIVKQIEALYPAIARAADLPLDQRRADISALDAAAMSAKNVGILGQLVPAFSQALIASDSASMQRAGLRLALAIHLYRAIHGQFPPTLDALVPEILPAIPQDALSSKPWVYRVELGTDPKARPKVVLYSIGTDGVDNGGASDGNPARAADPDNAGLDFMILPPVP